MVYDEVALEEIALLGEVMAAVAGQAQLGVADLNRLLLMPAEKAA